MGGSVPKGKSREDSPANIQFWSYSCGRGINGAVESHLWVKKQLLIHGREAWHTFSIHTCFLPIV